ncbi:MAG: AarF/ABC1/UbiB kinase family protein [Micavibrio aeruginosavorus]|uniref:AarF/ABC1/UbiB kinase family protein n=1 Tax=Micavibrio aeruginosavorus TaxID=349221 RepID=A0A7T5UIJ6_9BACT|nr:MAG: AarF/ABC1/UbiB kinase family protein [Micavibrio aeruginosavorus]
MATGRKRQSGDSSRPAAESEGSALTSRVARYGKVSATMAGLAARVAGERYLGLKIERQEHAQELLQSLGHLKGPLMKVGQILATIPEALPPEYAEALQQLQSNAPPMGWSFVRRRMKAELGPNWESRFKSFEREAAAAASLGQVHRAITPAGVHVACKLQYPDMQSAIDADLRQLKIIFSLYEKYDSAISTKYIHQELAARLYEELDYKREARHCALYADMLRHEKGVHVPEVIEDLSTGRLLTSTWLDGERILAFKEAPQEIRNKIALNLFRAWYVPFYFYGIIHGDPHLGNYTVRKDQSINLLDFGCIRVFPARFVGGVIDLYHALLEEDKARAVHAFETWGFRGLNKEQIETLTIWARFLYAPVLDDKVRTIGEVSGGMYGRETAHFVHQKLKEVGGVTVPREFVFMDRAALGLGSVFLHLKAEINWYKLFQELIADFETDALAKRQKKILKSFDISSEAPDQG